MKKIIYLCLATLLLIYSFTTAIEVRKNLAIEAEFQIEYESEIVPDPCGISGFICDIEQEMVAENKENDRTNI